MLVRIGKRLLTEVSEPDGKVFSDNGTPSTQAVFLGSACIFCFLLVAASPILKLKLWSQGHRQKRKGFKFRCLSVFVARNLDRSSALGIAQKHCSASLCITNRHRLGENSISNVGLFALSSG